MMGSLAAAVLIIGFALIVGAGVVYLSIAAVFFVDGRRAPQ